MSRRPRILLLIALGAVTLLCGGCVYWRLLQLKLQLGDFEKNFAVDTRDGLALTFKNPVLLDEDVEQFFHWVPDARQQSGTAEKWHFAWVKEPAAEEAGQPPFEIGLDLFFADHKLVKIVAPEKFFAATMPKSLALAALHSLGHAKIDQNKRQAASTIGSEEIQTAAADRFLSRPGLLAALGRPSTQTAKDGLEEWRYQFSPFSKRQRFGDSGVVDVTFTLDSTTGKVRLMKGRTMFGGMTFDTTNVGPNAKGTVNAALPQ
jgi:hypothetical protein